jgi:glutamate dehydrogenase
MAYCKIYLYAQLLQSDLPEDPYLGHDLERYFPPPLAARYDEQMRRHRLRREIIATVVANQVVDRAGTTFAFRLGEETGASAATLARAYAVSREIFDMRDFWKQVESLDNKVSAQTQLEMLIHGRRLVERASRWLVRQNPEGIDIAMTVDYFEPGAVALSKALPDLLEGADREGFDARAAELQEAGVAAPLALRVAAMPTLFSALDVVEVAKATGRPLESVTATYFRLGSDLELNWLRDRIIELPRANRWQALARAALRDDLYSLHRALAEEVLQAAGRGGDGSDPRRARDDVEAWVADHEPAVERCLSMIADIRASRSYDTTTLPVALREVRNLIGGAATAPGVAGIESITLAG